MSKQCWMIILVILLCYMLCRGNLRPSFHKPDWMKNACDMERKQYLKGGGLELIDNFLTPEECRHVINISKDRMERATVMASTRDEVSDYRTNYKLFLPRSSAPILERISRKVSEYTGIPQDHQESIQILRYDTGDQYYKKHYDACLDDTENCRRDNMRGMRIHTALIYLNEPGGGGETGFNNLDMPVSPKTGKAVMFRPVYQKNGRYEHHPCALHTAHPVTKGVKWNLTVWSRDKKMQ